jgi:hypothetical protein
MRLVEPKRQGQTLPQSFLAPISPCPNIEAIYILDGTEGQVLSKNTVYIVSDISPIVDSSLAYEHDVRAYNAELASISWVICAFINGRDRVPAKSHQHGLENPPDSGSILVVNGSTPRADREQDYHDWYDQEHGEKLTLVPGWNAARRYRLVKSYGEAQTASFYGFNYYDETNGLGGPEWKAGVTEWSLRIRSNAAKPNIRRVWKVTSTSSPQPES